MIFLSNCRKYDECSAISLRSGEAVFLRGVWRLEKYEVNGIDSTSFILNNPNYGDLTFKSDGIKTSGSGTYTAGNFKGGYSFFGGEPIDLTSSDTFNVSKNVLFARIPNHYSISFKITCLKKNHFWLKVDYVPGGYTLNNNNYYLRFKNVK